MNSNVFIRIALALVASFTFAANAATAPAQQSFASPDDAASALVAAIKADDMKSMRSVLGNAGGTLSSGDAVADKAASAAFVAEYDAKHSITVEGDNAKLVVGKDDFPFAFPLVKSGDRWHFDTAAGIEELNARRIGRNELDAIQVLGAIVDAQIEYASEDRDGDGVVAYAKKFVSTPGKKDGLHWATKPGEPPSPLGDLVARASSEGYRSSKSGPQPFHGYYYRMLKGQAASSDSPAFDYVVHGRQIGGFAAIAYPAKYASSGIMSFIVNQDGKVYQADLGPKTPERAIAIQKFDPGKGWTPVSTK